MRKNEKLLLGTLAMAGAVWAQQTTATFQAVVTDSTGGSVPQATVTMTHEGMGAIVTKTTSQLGEATFDFLRVGSYKIRIEAAGFKRVESVGMELSAAQNVRQTYVMEVGATSDTVTVAKFMAGGWKTGGPIPLMPSPSI